MVSNNVTIPIYLYNNISSCEQNGKVVHVYDGHGGNSSELVVLNSLHSSPLTFIEVTIIILLSILCFQHIH